MSIATTSLIGAASYFSFPLCRQQGPSVSRHKGIQSFTGKLISSLESARLRTTRLDNTTCIGISSSYIIINSVGLGHAKNKFVIIRIEEIESSERIEAAAFYLLVIVGYSSEEEK